MHQFVKKSRIAVIFLFTALVLIIYSAALYKIQIFDRASADTLLPPDTTTTTLTLTATRGNILDRNGELLVSSVPCYNISLSRDEMKAAGDINDYLLEIAQTITDYGESYTDTLPLTSGEPVQYVNMSSYQRSRLADYFEYFDIEANISSEDWFNWLVEHYSIEREKYDMPQLRKIIGLRYELECPLIMGVDDYILVHDASQELISILNEKGYPGVYVTSTYKREYHTKYAAHLLGYIRKMDYEDYEYYSQFDYPMNAYIGYDGVEEAFELYLHGTDGYKSVTTASDGTVVNETVLKEAVPGNNVELSIDIGLQKVAEDSLSDKITAINETRKPEDRVTGGAVVVEQVGTGEMLVSASYPTYDPATFLDNYTLLSAAENSPFLNRATMGLYNPGSTFKMVTALAGLRTGKITPYTTINDTGVYDEYIDDNFTLSCWIYGEAGYGHGTLDLVGALQNSCNYYFCWVGDHTGIKAISNAAHDFGFGQKTGLEIYEYSGYVADPDSKERLMEEEWYAADTLLASIGQSVHMFTPVQLANYVSTIASDGLRYKTTLLHNVLSSDYRTVIAKNAPEVVYKFSAVDRSYLPKIQEGMVAVAQSGSAATVFGNYKIPIAAKTGTTQSDSSSNNSGVFVCYAPADAPEIAISVVVERGTSGSTVMSIAADIIDAYFGKGNNVTSSIIYQGDLVE